LRYFERSLWTHPLLIPSYFALLSIVVLVAQAIFSSGPVRRLCGRDAPATTAGGDSGVSASVTRTGFKSAVKGHIEASGGPIIFFFQVTRLVAVLTLLTLAIFSFVQEEGQQQASPSSVVNALSKHWGKRRKGKHRYGGGGSLTKREWLDLTLCLTYVRHHCLFELAISLESSLAAVCGLLGVSHCYRPESSRVGYFVPSLLALAWYILCLCLPQHLATPHFHPVACGCI
jgi:hypothetical protein